VRIRFSAQESACRPNASDVAVQANVGLLGNWGSTLRVLEASKMNSSASVVGEPRVDPLRADAHPHWITELRLNDCPYSVPHLSSCASFEIFCVSIGTRVDAACFLHKCL
jgi:hypothetical protein